MVQLDEKIQRIFGNLDVKLLLGNIIYWLKKRIAKYAENNKKSLTLVYALLLISTMHPISASAATKKVDLKTPVIYNWKKTGDGR